MRKLSEESEYIDSPLHCSKLFNSPMLLSYYYDYLYDLSNLPLRDMRDNQNDSNRISGIANEYIPELSFLGSIYKTSSLSELMGATEAKADSNSYVKKFKLFLCKKGKNK